MASSLQSLLPKAIQEIVILYICRLGILQKYHSMFIPYGVSPRTFLTKEPKMKMNILVVDDEVPIVESIRMGLEYRGYKVLGAFNAQQALDLLTNGDLRIDLVITDYMMPKMNGLELLIAIRRNHPTLPVMIMTGYAETHMTIEALNNHCDSFIEKPVSPNQLIEKIDKIKRHLLQNTKSRDLHQLLPRIVHQINNPLTAISCFAQMIRLNVDNGVTLQENVKEILAAVKQISLINKEIINAGRAEMSARNPVELDALLDGCLKMFNGLFILKNIQVEKKTPVHGLRIQGDQFSLEQVFKNLILNAVDAMDGQSEKKLSTSIMLLPDSTSVEIAIEDTGCGIREELLSKIFDPYFTEKRGGNGLGLEIIRDVVEKHDGTVSVESRVGSGSKFFVRLPVIQMAEPRDSLHPNNENRVRSVCMDTL
jgi:signal transduction histidine kinase